MSFRMVFVRKVAKRSINTQVIVILIASFLFTQQIWSFSKQCTKAGFSALFFRHLRQCIWRVHNIVSFAGQIDWSATSICVKIIVSWEADARYSITPRVGAKSVLRT